MASWQMIRVRLMLDSDENLLADLLEDGWEPYAVTTDKYSVPTHYLRRQTNTGEQMEDNNG